MPLIAAVLLANAAHAIVQTKNVDYKQGDATLEGYLAYDDSLMGKRPGVLIIHDWMGIGANVKKRAEKIAKLGYVAFVADIYGKSVRPANGEEASKLAGKFKGDRNLLRERVQAALAALKGTKQTDTKKTAAIGYCFGGTTALELMRSGADVEGVVSFHAGLDSPLSKATNKNFKGKVLALHGADDPFESAEEVAGFQKEMRDSGIDWQFISYGGAVHSFTIPDAGSDNSKGAAYNEKADRRSWEAMRDFLTEIFASSH